MAQAPLNRYDVIHYKRDDCSFEDFAHFFTKEYPLRAGPISEFQFCPVVSENKPVSDYLVPVKKYGIVQWASVRRCQVIPYHVQSIF